MKRPALSTAAAAAGCSLVLLLTGCGSDDSTASSEGSSEEVAVGPLEEYFSAMTEGLEDQDYEAMSAQAEEITAACMREQGFDYTPQDTSQYSEAVETVDEGPAWDSLEFAKENGYGMTVPPEVVEEAPEEEYVDANADYVASMSESEQQAYYEALYGVPPEFDESDPEAAPEYDWTTAGCSGRAQHEVFEEGQPFDDPQFASLQEEMSALYEQAASDSKIAELNAEWPSCMADAGFDGFASPEEAQTSISNQLNAIYEDSGETGEPDQGAMDELREVEIDTAVADRTCQEDLGYTEAVQEVQFAREQHFIDSHQAELDAMLEAYSSAGE